MDHENLFFEYKMSKYQSIIILAVDLLDIYYETFEKFKPIAEKEHPDASLINLLADEIDRKTKDFRLDLIRHMLLLPEDIGERLIKFHDGLYKQSESIMPADLIKEKIDKVLEQLKLYEEDLDNVIDLMRTDLGVEFINGKLKERTQPLRFVFLSKRLSNIRYQIAKQNRDPAPEKHPDDPGILPLTGDASPLS